MYRNGGLVIAIVFTTSVICSCQSERYSSDPQIRRNDNSNVVRYLDDVECDKKSEYCGNESYPRIREMCVDNGFMEERPKSKVLYSRKAEEKVEGYMTLLTPREEYGYQEDENEIVTGTRKTVTDAKSVFVVGVCIGSEYITE